MIRFALVVLIFCSFTVNADSWTSPKGSASISPDGNVIVRIVPGQGSPAKATFFRWIDPDSYHFYQEITLNNSVSPGKALISNDRRLITFDNWFSFGYGEVVTIYKPSGEVLVSYTLEQLYAGKDMIEKFSHSTSSIWWRCSSTSPDLFNGVVEVMDSQGGIFKFNLESGLFSYYQSDLECKLGV